MRKFTIMTAVAAVLLSSCTVTEEQAGALRILLDARGWRFSEQPYARWKAVREKTNIVAYNSGKLTVQGGGTADFVTFVLEPEILHTFGFGYAEESKEEPVDPHGGVDEIKPYVDEFIEFAKAHSEYRFLVTRIGCGIAGFRDEDIAPLFRNALKVENIYLPGSFIEVLSR